MTQILDARTRDVLNEAIKTGELDLLTLPELVPLLRGYVRGRKAMDALVRKGRKERGESYTPEPIRAPVKVQDRGSFLTLWAAKEKGVLTIPQAWIEKVQEYNRAGSSLYMVKEVADERAKAYKDVINN